jgi:hypothetical protein
MKARKSSRTKSGHRGLAVGQNLELPHKHNHNVHKGSVAFH